MLARPTLIASLIAAAGAAALLFAAEWLPASRYGSAALGAVCAGVTTAALLRELRRRDRLSIATGAGALGFLAGAAAASGTYPWPLGFAGAWLPALLLFFGGVGRERLAFELERLEGEMDAPALRQVALRRATKIRDDAAAVARSLDPEASGEPLHAGDARAVYAYAAQVTGYALALDGRFDDAIASLGDVPAVWMPSPMRPLMLSNLSHWRLCAGDLEGARRAMDAATEEGALPEVRPFLRGARAAVLVREGEIEAALDLVGRKDGELGEPPAVKQRYRITRAHALAAKGKLEAARGELRRVVDDGGVEEIKRWLPAGGPAAEEMKAFVDER